MNLKIFESKEITIKVTIKIITKKHKIQTRKKKQ